MRPAGDAELVQIVDAALADATLRAQTAAGTSWLTCRPGCTPCCHGVFRISALDAERLRDALRSLRAEAPERAAALEVRAHHFAAKLGPAFPGDPTTGVLWPEQADEDELPPDDDQLPTEDEQVSAWDAFADLPEADAPCPALDPATGRCELYAGRPLTCRVFGPPVQNEGGLGVCELCYVGASEADLLGGEMYLTHHALEAALDRELPPTETVIAWALLQMSL